MESFALITSVYLNSYLLRPPLSRDMFWTPFGYAPFQPQGDAMARTKRSAKLDTRNARLKLAPEVRHQEPLSPGRYLAYRRPKSGAAGSWLARWYDKETRKDGQERLGTADDFQDADGLAVLTYSQAQAKSQAWFAAREHQALHGDNSTPQDGPLTVDKAMDRYLARNEAQGGKSVKDMRQRVELWIKPSLGSIEIAKLTRAKVEAWHQSIAESDRKPRPKKGTHERPPIEKKTEAPEGPAPTMDAKRKRKATANRILSVLKAALTCARVQGWVTCPGDAWELVKPFRAVEEPRQQYLTPNQQTRLINSIDAPDFRNLVAGALFTGCRYGELCRVLVKDFDNSGAGSILISEAKGGKPRRVILTSEGKSFFQSITAGRRTDELIFRRDKAERRSRTGKGGDDRGWSSNDQQRLMLEACRNAGLPEMGFHQLRHSYASALVAAGMPMAMVAKLTGHADTRMLERHYAHLATSDLSRALEALAPTLNVPIASVADLAIKRG